MRYEVGSSSIRLDVDGKDAWDKRNGDGGNYGKGFGRSDDLLHGKLGTSSIEVGLKGLKYS